MTRCNHIDRSIADRGNHSLPVRFLPQGRGKLGICTEFSDRQIGKHIVRRRNPCGHGHAARFRRADQIERSPGCHLTEVEPRTGHFGQRNIACHGQCLCF